MAGRMGLGGEMEDDAGPSGSERLKHIASARKGHMPRVVFLHFCGDVKFWHGRQRHFTDRLFRKDRVRVLYPVGSGASKRMKKSTSEYKPFRYLFARCTAENCRFRGGRSEPFVSIFGKQPFFKTAQAFEFARTIVMLSAAVSADAFHAPAITILFLSVGNLALNANELCAFLFAVFVKVISEHQTRRVIIRRGPDRREEGGAGVGGGHWQILLRTAPTHRSAYFCTITASRLIIMLNALR